jgi:hypothetical protein
MTGMRRVCRNGKKIEKNPGKRLADIFFLYYTGYFGEC